MAYRPLLTLDQWAPLVAVPADEENMIRHYTLNRDDISRVLAKRGHRNRLGFAVQLCLMRFPGRALLAGEEMSLPFLNFVSEQIAVSSAVFADYARRDETRREHALEIQQYLSLRPANRDDRRAALLAAISASAAADKGTVIAEAVVKSFRDRQVLLPGIDRLDKIGRAGRAIARKQANLAVLEGRTAEQLAALDALVAFDPAIRQTRFGWLGAWSDSPSAANLNGLLDRLDFLRGLALDPACRDKIHPERWKQIVREGRATPSWLAEDFGAERRRATVLAYLVDLAEKLADEAIGMFCKQIGRLFARANAAVEQRHRNDRKETTKVLRLFRDTLRVLIEANESDGDALDMLSDKIGWHRLIQAQPTLEAMVAEENSNPLLLAAQRYSSLRKFVPRFLEAFVFHSSRRHDPALAAVEALRKINRENRRTLPDRLPTGHLAEAARKQIFAAGAANRRLYEIATLAVLRDRLRSGDIWVEGSRAYRPLAEYLMPKAVFVEKKEADRLGLNVPGDAQAWLDQAQQALDFRLKQLAYRARAGKLEGVRLENGVLVVSPLRNEVPDEAEALKWELNHYLPSVHITDLLAEVDSWTNFSGKFTHLRTMDTVRNPAAILAAVLADATNLGAKRMAEASANVSERQITWARLFHIRPETYKAAQAVIADAHSAHPHANLWGRGATSSSDGQFFRAGDRAVGRSDVNLHYGSDPGSKFYSHISDQYGYYSILPISPSESEAPYVLDGLYDHETKLDIEEHFTDTSGASDHVFGLFALLGKRFSPRLRNLKDRKFHTFGKADAYPTLKNHIGHSINVDLIRAHWDELLHMAASMNERVIAPSAILKKLSASRRAGELSQALQEVGRVERTLFMIEWYSDPKLRRRCLGGLNKGESAHKLKRAVFFHERGEVRDRSFDSQAFRASGLNLVVSAIVHWNTVYLARVAAHLRAKGKFVPDELLRHVSPLSWEHINLTGTYSWQTEPGDPTVFRELRAPNSFADAA